MLRGQGGQERKRGKKVEEWWVEKTKKGAEGRISESKGGMKGLVIGKERGVEKMSESRFYTVQIEPAKLNVLK